MLFGKREKNESEVEMLSVALQQSQTILLFELINTRINETKEQIRTKLSNLTITEADIREGFDDALNTLKDNSLWEALAARINRTLEVTETKSILCTVTMPKTQHDELKNSVQAVLTNHIAALDEARAEDISRFSEEDRSNHMARVNRMVERLKGLYILDMALRSTTKFVAGRDSLG